MEGEYTIKIIIEGKPVPQGRPRASFRGGRVNVRDPDTSRNYKRLVAWAARSQFKQKPFTGAVKVHVDIYRQIPKSTSGIRTKRKENKEIRPIVRPDIDNYLKSIFDGLDKIIWNDDSQIVMLSANKYYSINPRVELTVKELDHD